MDIDENLYMTNKHILRFSTLLVIREMPNQNHNNQVGCNKKDNKC